MTKQYKVREPVVYAERWLGEDIEEVEYIHKNDVVMILENNMPVFRGNWITWYYTHGNKVYNVMTARDFIETYAEFDSESYFR